MNKNKKWRNAGLYALLAIVVIALATAFLDQEPQNQKTWRYSKFVNQVESGKIEQVKISSDRSQAMVTAQDGTQIQVNLPPDDPQLLDVLTENGVDISIQP